jgi:hypothetical protein
MGVSVPDVARYTRNSAPTVHDGPLHDHGDLLIRKPRWDRPCDALNPEQDTFFNPRLGACHAPGRAKNSGNSLCRQRKSDLFATYGKISRSVEFASERFMTAGATDHLPQA